MDVPFVNPLGQIMLLPNGTVRVEGNEPGLDCCCGCTTCKVCKSSFTKKKRNPCCLNATFAGIESVGCNTYNDASLDDFAIPNDTFNIPCSANAGGQADYYTTVGGFLAGEGEPFLNIFYGRRFNTAPNCLDNCYETNPNYAVNFHQRTYRVNPGDPYSGTLPYVPPCSGPILYRSNNLGVSVYFRKSLSTNIYYIEVLGQHQYTKFRPPPANGICDDGAGALFFYYKGVLPAQPNLCEEIVLTNQLDGTDGRYSFKNGTLTLTPSDICLPPCDEEEPASSSSSSSDSSDSSASSNSSSSSSNSDSSSDEEMSSESDDSDGNGGVDLSSNSSLSSIDFEDSSVSFDDSSVDFENSSVEELSSNTEEDLGCCPPEFTSITRSYQLPMLYLSPSNVYIDALNAFNSGTVTLIRSGTSFNYQAFGTPFLPPDNEYHRAVFSLSFTCVGDIGTWQATLRLQSNAEYPDPDGWTDLTDGIELTCYSGKEINDGVGQGACCGTTGIDPWLELINEGSVTLVGTFVVGNCGGEEELSSNSSQSSNSTNSSSSSSNEIPPCACDLEVNNYECLSLKLDDAGFVNTYYLDRDLTGICYWFKDNVEHPELNALFMGNYGPYKLEVKLESSCRWVVYITSYFEDKFLAYYKDYGNKALGEYYDPISMKEATVSFCVEDESSSSSDSSEDLPAYDDNGCCMNYTVNFSGMSGAFAGFNGSYIISKDSSSDYNWNYDSPTLKILGSPGAYIDYYLYSGETITASGRFFFDSGLDFCLPETGWEFVYQSDNPSEYPSMTITDCNLSRSFRGDFRTREVQEAPVIKAPIIRPVSKPVILEVNLYAGLWEELHTFTPPEEKSDKVQRFLKKFIAKVPCGECRKHFRAWCIENPAPDQWFGYFEWTVRAHNAVNKRIGLKEWTVFEAMNKWKKI